MKSTGKKLFIRNKNRNVYLKNGKYYYRYCNEYHLIKRRLIGGDDDANVEEPKADQEDIKTFVGDKKFTYKKIKLFENVVKYYKDYLDVSILDKIKKSLKFLTDYNDKINVIIDMFKHDDNGELSSDQVRMLITHLKKFIFEKIFVNYFIDIISIYYDNSRSAKKEIEDAMHMLTFVENDKKEELVYKQKINILLKRLIEYGEKNANDREKAYEDFSVKLAALKNGKSEDDDDDEEEGDDGEYSDMSEAKFAGVKPGVLTDLKANFEKQELILIKIQGTFYWWDKMRTIVEKEFKETDNKYIRAFEIFINELLRETILFDIKYATKREEIKLEKDRIDPELYEIYRKFIRLTFVNKMQSSEISRSMINGTLSESDYNGILDEIDKGNSSQKEPTQDQAGLKRYFIRELDKSIKKRKDDKRRTITGLIDTRQKNMNNRGVGSSVGSSVGSLASSLGSSSSMITAFGGGQGQAGELLEAEKEMENEEKKLVKMKKILKDDVLKYIEILNIMVTAKEQKILTESNDDIDEGGANKDEDDEENTIVNKQSFKDMASILIVYLKQHILSFSLVYKQVIGDIKNVHTALSKEIKELEKKIAEYKSE